MVLDLLIQLVVFVGTVNSCSMCPTMNIGDSYTVNTTVPFDSLQEGDIIAFKVPHPEILREAYPNDTEHWTEFIVHRVKDLDHNDAGQITHITTQGDNEDTNSKPWKGVDLTDSIDRAQLLDLYVGQVTLGSHPIV